MKNLNIIILLAFLMIVSSCDLERLPYSSIEKSQSFETIKDAKDWNTGLYSYFRSRQYGDYTQTQDIQADQLNASLAYGNRYGLVHNWVGFLSSSGYISEVWRGYYSAIANINVMINGFNTINLEKNEDKIALERYKSEAYLARAYYYHQLVLRWSKAYDKSTADSDLGVPILTSFDLSIMPKRASTSQVYDQIMSDIEKAKVGLMNVEGKKGANRFNKDVLRALEARVRLDMSDWEGAYKVSKELIEESKYPLIDNEEDFKKMWKDDYPQEVIFQSFVAAPDELPRTNSQYLGYDPGNNKYSPDYIPSQWVIDMYDTNDIRKSVYFDKKVVEIDGNTYNNLLLVDKYPGNPALFTEASTNYAQSPKVFRIAEIYLIAAEAASNLDSDTDAKLYLNLLRKARGLSSINSSGTDLRDDIRNERTKELAFEGFRLFDLKRWKKGIKRHDPQNPIVLVTGDNNINLDKPNGSDKFVWGIPSWDITINPNIKQNPGW